MKNAFGGFWEDGGEGEFEVRLVPQARLANSHISATNPENDPKIGRTDFP